MDKELKVRAIALLDDLAGKCGLTREGLQLAHPEVGAVARIKELRSSGRGRKGLGRLYISVGQYGDVTTYQERKVGGFRLDLHAIIDGRVQGYLREKELRRRKSAAQKRAKEWLREQGVSIGPMAGMSSPSGKPKIRLHIDLSLEQAERLLPLLRDMGKV